LRVLWRCILSPGRSARGPPARALSHIRLGLASFSFHFRALLGAARKIRTLVPIMGRTYGNLSAANLRLLRIWRRRTVRGAATQSLCCGGVATVGSRLHRWRRQRRSQHRYAHMAPIMIGLTRTIAGGFRLWRVYSGCKPERPGYHAKPTTAVKPSRKFGRYIAALRSSVNSYAFS
jgi:hypothetical protein